MQIPLDLPIEPIIELDHKLFELINTQWTHPWLDAFMPVATDLFRNPTFLYYILPVIIGLYLFFYRYNGFKVIMCLSLAVFISDTVSYQIIKQFVQRDRPEKVLTDVHLRTDSHSGFSFPSNHAANTMAGAFVLDMVHPRWRYLFYLFAFIVAYSRVYVGVHFPIDVLAGMIVGFFCSLFVVKIILYFHPEIFYGRYVNAKLAP